MAELDHNFGGDLSLSANGDLLTADSLILSQQAVLRRLLTNAGDYIWQLDYGAGLPSLVGQPVNVAQVTALVRSQMFLERSVARNPEPVITVTAFPNGMAVNIQYTEIDSGQTALLQFSVKE